MRQSQKRLTRTRRLARLCQAIVICHQTLNKHYHMRKGSNGVKWLEGYHRTIRILVVPRGCSWHNEDPGATVRKQVNHGILSSSSDEEVFRHMMMSDGMTMSIGTATSPVVVG